MLAKCSPLVLKHANVFMQNKLSPSGEGEGGARLHCIIKSLAYHSTEVLSSAPTLYVWKSCTSIRVVHLSLFLFEVIRTETI